MKQLKDFFDGADFYTDDFAIEIRDRAFEYERDVESGKQIAPETIKQAVKRSIRLRKKYVYDEADFLEAAEFFALLRIPIDDEPTEFLPAPWQCWILLNLFGIKDHDGKRLFTEALVFVARKSGKTMFGAALSILYLVKYGGMSAQCFGAATVQKQARQLMDYAKTIVRNSPHVDDILKRTRDYIEYDDGSSTHKLEQLSEQQAERADGSNPSYCLYDEAHAFKNEKLKEVVITGMGARKQPLFLTVTTAGFLTVGYPLFTQIELARKVLKGEVDDDRTFYALYELDKESEAEGPIENLVKANPGLGYAVDPKRLEAQRDKAFLLPTSWRHFLVKNCNIFQTEKNNPFISDENFLKCCGPVNLEEWKGGRAWIGLDLSKNIDLTAFTVLVEHPQTCELTVIPVHFFPKNTDHPERNVVRANGVDLTSWIDEGLIIQHEDKIDKNDVYEHILQYCRDYRVQVIGYDPFSAHDIVAKLKANLDELIDVQIIPVSQAITTLSPPTKYFEELVIGQDIKLGQNPVLRYCNSNSYVQYSRTSNLIRVIKDEDLNPIDSIISTIIAIATYMHTEFTELEHLLNDN